MKKIVFIMVVLLLWQSALAGVVHVAVVETIGSNSFVSYDEKLFITDRLREKANEALPSYMGFNIMTRENINAMLPPGKKIDDCLGECLVETGRNISADYIAQARIGDFNGSATITVELYETRGNKLLGTFSGMSYDAGGLLEVVEEKASGLFALISGAGGDAGPDGISGFSGGDGYSSNAVQSYIIELESEPRGVMVSVDGYPDTQCPSTPCSIQLKSGSHRISFAKEKYFNADTVVYVNQNNKKLSVSLKPNFGTLTLSPQLESGIGQLDELEVTIDDEIVNGNNFKLSSGIHSVSISHHCYESVHLKVNVKNGRNQTYDKRLTLKKGKLDLTAFDDGSVASLPVYVNGEYAGETHFFEIVPVCSKITIGERREEIPVKIKEKETVAYRHEFRSRPDFIDRRDGERYEYVQIGSQVWMAEAVRYAGRDKYTHSEAEDACPAGWSLPSTKDYEQLNQYAGSFSSQKLRASSGWILPSLNGIDTYGFSATSEESVFWAADGHCSINPIYANVECARGFLNDDTGEHSNFFIYKQASSLQSVRCIKDGFGDLEYSANYVRSKTNATSLGVFVGFAAFGDSVVTMTGLPIGLFTSTYLGNNIIQLTLGFQYFLQSGSEIAEDSYYSYEDLDDAVEVSNQASIFAKIGFLDDRHWLKIGFQMEKIFGEDMLWGGYIKLAFFTLLGDISVVGNGNLIKAQWTYPIDVFKFAW